MALGRGNRDVSKLLAAAHTAEHQPAAAHVSSSGKFGGEEKPLAEDLQQRLDVFWRGHAAEEYDLTIDSDLVGKQARIAFERNAVTLVRQGNRGSGDRAQFFSCQQFFGRKQPAPGRNHERAIRFGRRVRERFGVGELPAEI